MKDRKAKASACSGAFRVPYTAEATFTLHRNPLRFRGLMFGQPPLQDAIGQAGLDLLAIYRGWQREHALEAAAPLVPPVVVRIGRPRLRLALPAQGQGAVVDLDLDSD